MDLDRNAARSVREAFLDAGFTADGLLVALGPSAYAALGRGEPVPAQRALADRQDPLAALARLFVLGAEIPREDAARAIPLAELVELGLVTASGAVRARVDVRPYGESDTDWYVVSDHGPDSAGHDVEEVAVDHVLGVGGASLTLARITPRATVARALDLGTGCGVQALHLGRHATEVVATDRNRRALRLAAVSAALSGQEWDLREGSLFEPVAGEAFDLVVSNPPFVISPGHRYTYRDAGLPADDLGRLLVQQAPGHLVDGGTAVILANWLHVDGEDWRDRVAAWVATTGCDAWVAQREVQDPAEYVGLWLRDAGGLAGDAQARAEHEQRYSEWLDALRAMNAEGIGFGWIVLHKGGTYGASGPRVEDVATAARVPRGDEVAALVAARSGWAAYDAFALLASRPVRSPGLRILEEERADDQGQLAALPPRAGAAQGWRQDALVDSVTLHLLRLFDGATTVADAVDLAAAAYSLDADDVLPGALLTTRALVEDGLLRLP